MKTLCTALATILLLPCIATALPVQLRWRAETSDPKPFRADIWRGETVELRAQLRQYGVDVALPASTTASLWYQTNGMGSAWWQGAATATTNGLLSATWSPALDAGAGSYVFFIGAADAASNMIYRAHGQIRMLGSPGATPNALPLPRQSIDFDTLDILNPPWATPADLAPATNALALASTALQPPATNGLLRSEADTLATVTARGATTLDEITARNFIGGRYGANAGSFANGTGWGAYGENAGSYASGDQWGAYGASAGESAYGNYWGAYGENAGSYASGNAWGAYGRMAGYKADHNNSHAFGRYAGYLARGDSRLYIDVYAAEPGYAANGAINDRIFGDTDGKLYLGRGEGAPGGAVGGTLRGPWTGGGFATYLAATNIAAAAIEDILSETNALLVVSNEVATIETNGVPIWSSASGAVPPSVTNELWQSIAALQGTVSALQGTVAALSHAWGEYAPDGSPNPDPDYMLWINRPATVWGAGFQWAVSGGHAVLIATGTVAFAAGGSGEMRIGPGDGTNYFGFVTGGSVEVGASASGITVADDVATIIYPYETGDFPTLWFTADLSTPFEIMTGVVWVDNADGTATVTAPATTERGFWRATTSATFATEFQSTMPARFTGGVWGAADAFPVKYDSTITIQSGGKSYRIVAEEVH